MQAERIVGSREHTTIVIIVALPLVAFKQRCQWPNLDHFGLWLVHNLDLGPVTCYTAKQRVLSRTLRPDVEAGRRHEPRLGPPLSHHSISDRGCPLDHINTLCQVCKLLLLIELNLEYFLVFIFQNNHIRVVVSDKERSQCALVELTEPYKQSAGGPADTLAALISDAHDCDVMVGLLIRVFHFLVNADRPPRQRQILSDRLLTVVISDLFSVRVTRGHQPLLNKRHKSAEH